MSSWHTYPKVYALGHREVRTIFETPVSIEEKIDGSQISFGIIDGELKVKSKSVELILDDPEKMFYQAVEVIKSKRHLLTPNYTYRGEYLKNSSHNALKYERIPNDHIIIFDVNTDHEEYMNYEDKKKHCDSIGLEVVPLLYYGFVADPTKLPEMIDNKSCLGGVNMEGIVVKNYSIFGSDKKALMAKFVSEQFKEIQKKEWKEKNPKSHDILQLIISSLKTEARFNKAIQHMKESGKLDGSPRDIGELMKELESDIKAECVDFISEKLVNWALPNVIRGVRAGFPEWYKKYLIESAYKSSNEVIIT